MTIRQHPGRFDHIGQAGVQRRSPDSIGAHPRQWDAGQQLAASQSSTNELPVLWSLESLAELVGDRDDLYVRWSRGPHHDRRGTSKDELSGVPLPGLSASALGVEPWWGDRDRSVWVARRIHDYAHLPVRRHGEIRPWVLEGTLCGRGPDNEPLVSDVTPVAWIDEVLIGEADEVIAALNSTWGSLDRPASRRSAS